ncbi:MAG: type II secretion system F family protein [Candidatus Berkelbacteria bacterium]|nr:type II secretion system F family protein [Candidatus Berkelbacteria bacterium]
MNEKRADVQNKEAAAKAKPADLETKKEPNTEKPSPEVKKTESDQGKDKNPPTIEVPTNVEKSPTQKAEEKKEPAKEEVQSKGSEKETPADEKAPKEQEPAPEAPKEKVKKRSWLSNLGLGQEKEYFIENLSMLLASGMNIIAALEAVKAGVKSRSMKNIIEVVKQDIDDGSPVWKAIDKTGILSEHSVSLIRIGEESGRLPANLKVISIQNQKERIFRSKIVSALLYPVAVLFLTLVIGVGIAWFILPKLAKVFDSLRMELPITTKILITVGNFLGSYGKFVVPAFILLFLLAFYIVFVYKRTRSLGQKIIFILPGIKVLIQQIELARFGFILGNLLDAGMPLVDALASLKEVSSFTKYQGLYVFLRDNIEEGYSFQKCFSMYKGIHKLIPFPVQQMIVTSEQSGSLKETLISIGEMFEEKTDISTKNLATILEPVMLFAIWLVVLFVALSVIMPIYNLIGGFNE